MKLKKKAILYMEGMLDKKEEKKFLKELRNRPDIEQFMNTYHWIDGGLDLYFDHYHTKENEKNINDIDEIAIKNIEKYLVNYKPSGQNNEQEFRKRLNHVMHEEKKHSTFHLGFILNIAASLAFIALIIAGMIHFSEVKRSRRFQQGLYANYFKPKEDNFLKSLDTDFSLPTDPENKNIESENFLSHSDELMILRDGNTSPQDVLILSVSLILKKDYALADEYLTGLADINIPQVSDAARWYLSLSKIEQGDIKKAMHYLQILCSESLLYKEHSCELLKNLENKATD